ncbi:MAG: hypothetical protein KGL50_03710 [Burkholderiales bacterium]|nr:hypothetical protein [Burkholderiales bacterium]
MPRASLPPKPAAPAPASDRRAADPLRKLKGALLRPLALQRQDGRLHIVLVDRRRPEADETWLPGLRSELKARLRARGLDAAAPVVRHLLFVHDALQAGGWRRVEVLPARVLAKALAQAGLLGGECPAPQLERFAARLQAMQAQAQAREARAEQGRQAGQAPIEVSEASAEDFAEAERRWLGAVPAAVGSGEGGSAG